MKRQRQDEDDQQNTPDKNGQTKESTMERDNATMTTNATSTASATTDIHNKDSDPAYGSKEYWEKRYKKNEEHEKKKTVQLCEETVSSDGGICCNNNNNNDKSNGDNDDISPGHVWYFTYQELKSLILPLILDARGEEFDQWSDTDEDDEHSDDGNEKGDQNKDEDNDGWEEDEEDDNNENNDKEGNVDENLEEEESEECDESYSNIYKSKGESEIQLKPKKILEIGCGDVPLGCDIYQNLQELQSMTGVNAKSVVDQIICFDYSATVIDLLLNNEKNLEKDSSSLKNDRADFKVEYKVYDARKLPLKERQFDLILDKGTLDAMLSDKDEGMKNCVQIVSEASRLLAPGGYLLIVSHLNACNSEGLSWVEEVLMTGLRDGDEECDWRIEVHSNDNVEQDNVTSENEKDEQKDDGPAVYIIQKQDCSHNISEKKINDEKNISKVALKFFGY